jgi:hypothetical protein
MDEYVTKHVDVKRVVSPTDTLLLETSNNIVIDTDPDRILVGGMRLPDYIESQIFRVTNAPTTPSDLEGTSAKSADATVNFDAVYSNSGEFRADETRCAGVDASGSYIDAVRAHAISLDGASDIRLSAKTVDNIYVKSQSMREVIYSMVNRARVRNSARYDIRAFEHTPVTYSATGRESAHLGTVHTNTLRTHKITTNHTLIDGQQPDLVIRSSAGVSMNTPNLYLNNELFQEYIKQFMDERQFFTLTVNTSPGSIIPYDLSDFTVREHGSTFDYQVQLFMYQKDTPDSEVQSGVAAHEDESSVHVINTVQFPYGPGKVLYEGSFRNLTPGQYYNMYADFLNLRTMTLVPKVHVMDDVLTVTLKYFTIEIINESLIAFHIQKYQEELTELYGPAFVFNLLINDSNVDSYSLSNTELRVVPSVYDTPYANLSNLIQTSKAISSNDKLVGALVFDNSNSNLFGGPRSNVKTTVGYIDYDYTAAAAFPLTTISAPVYNYGSSHTFNVYTPLLKILTPTQTLSNNVYSNAYISNVIDSDTSNMITKIDTHTHTQDGTSTNFYKFSISGSNLSNNWPYYTDPSPYSNLPKFDYLSFGVMLTVDGSNNYIYVPRSNNDSNAYEHIIKYRATFSNTDKDMQIYIDTTNSNIEQAPTSSTTAGSVILTGNTNDITISLLYKSIYNDFNFYSNQRFGNMILKALRNADSNVAVTPVASNIRQFQINLDDSNIHFVDNRLTYVVSNFEIYVDPAFTSVDWSNVSNVASITHDKHYNITGQTLTYRVPNDWSNNQIKVNIRDNLGRNFDYTSLNYTINDIIGSIGGGTVTSANYNNSPRKFSITPTISTISTGRYSNNGGNVSMSSSPNAALSELSANTEGYITYSNTTSDTRYTLTLSYTDPYGFSNTSIQKVFTIYAITGSIADAQFASKPRKFTYRTRISNISDNIKTYASPGVWSNISVTNGGIHVTLPNASNFDNSDGVFEASNNTTINSYTISNQYTDRYGFFNTISGTVDLPSGYNTFNSPTIAWDGTIRSRTFEVSAPSNHDLRGTYNWYVATSAGSNSNEYIQSGTYTNSNIQLKSTLTRDLYLKCLNISLDNAMGFTGSQNATNLSLNQFIASGTFATYSVAFTTGGTPRRFELTAGTPATTTIDGVTNTNTPQSYAWSNSSNLLSSTSNCDLVENYLSSNELEATIYCVVTTRNIVGFDDKITTDAYTVAGRFPEFTGSHTLSFTSTTTPNFTVTVDSNEYTSNNSDYFVLTYEGSSNDTTYSNVTGTNYSAWKYIRMVGRTVCDRGFHNISTSNLATFDATSTSNIPGNPPAPTVKTVEAGGSNIEVKTCTNITFSPIASNEIGSHGTPPRSDPTIAIKRSSNSNTDNTGYSNAVPQGFGNEVVVSNLDPGTTYYFKYSKSYSNNLWTAVDYFAEYISSNYTPVTTLRLPSVSGNIYSQYYSRYDLILVLENLVYPTLEANYSSDYTIKLLVSQTSNSLLNVDTLRVAETFSTYRYGGSIRRIIADGNMSNMTGNDNGDDVYEIEVPSESSNAGEVKIGHSADVVYTDYYVAIKLEFDNTYPNIIGPISAGRTSYQRPDIPKFQINPNSVTVNLRTSNLRIIFDSTGLVWNIVSRGTPSKNPSKIIMVATTDSNVMRNDNINFSANTNSNYLKQQPASNHIYSTADVITRSNFDYVDLDIHDGTVRTEQLSLFFISIYNTFSNNEIPGYGGTWGSYFVYNNWINAMPYNTHNNMWETNNFVKKLTLRAPNHPSNLTVTVQNSTTSIQQLVWRHDSVTYNHSNYEVYQHKWAIDESLAGGFTTQTSNVSGAPNTGSNYEISPVPNSGVSYYVKLYVSYDNTSNWKSVITSSQISTPIPEAPSYTAANVIKTTLYALGFNSSLIQTNSHKGFDSLFTKYHFKIQSGSNYAEGSSGNLSITGLRVNQTYHIDIVKKYSNQGVEWDSDTFTLSNIQTRNYDPPSQSMLGYYGRLNNGIYFGLISLQTNEYFKSVSSVSLKSNTGLKSTVTTTTAGDPPTTIYRVEPDDPFPDTSYSNIQFTLEYSPYSDPTAVPPIDYSDGVNVNVDTTTYTLPVKTSHFTVDSSAITVHPRIGFTINLTSSSYYFVPAAMGGHTYSLRFVSVYVYTDSTFTTLDTEIPLFGNGADYMLKLQSGQMTANYYGPYTGNRLYLKFKLISDHPLSTYKFREDHIVYEHPTPLDLGSAYMGTYEVDAYETVRLVNTRMENYGPGNTWVKLTFKESYNNLRICGVYYEITAIEWRINSTELPALRVGADIHNVHGMSVEWDNFILNRNNKINWNKDSRTIYFPRRWFNGWIRDLRLNLTLKTDAVYNGTTYESSTDVTWTVHISQTENVISNTVRGYVHVNVDGWSIGPWGGLAFSGEPVS